ncbi:MAG: Fur family transcriptional regulator [Anaerolineales bacterium]|jgi:Fur family ferric uptake transcriptional regulator
MSCTERLTREMRRLGFRVTPQRAVILETIAHGDGHQSAAEVFKAANQRLPGLNIATVYRTLDSLHRAGMVDLLSTDASIVRFELRDPQHPHSHLVCRACGQVMELPSEFIETFAEGVREDHGFALDTQHLTLTGLCAQCSQGASELP